MEILELFGIDWKLMLAQLINFAIVVLVLWKFAVKPLTETMDKRNKEIEQGLFDAEKAKEKLEKVEEEVKEQLQETKREAAVILDKARQQSEENKQASVGKTKEEVEALIKKAKIQIESEKDSMVAEVKSEVAKMIVTALEKILSEGLSKDLDKKYIDKVLKDLK
ncbi:ATP synthase F0 subunit B [Candidatus Parcubacteria bacterium]|nr:MAG: ATP synthase F0 subunit B [Candidatus Parcubacteria bacterium]